MFAISGTDVISLLLTERWLIENEDFLPDIFEITFQTFSRLFQQATTVNGGDIMMPRPKNRHRNQSNVPADSAEEYYKRAIFLLFIDTCTGQLTERFSEQSVTACQMSALHQTYCTSTSSDFDIETAGTFYRGFLPDEDVTALHGILAVAAVLATAADNSSTSSATDALRVAEELGTYPALSVLLRIFAMLPVTPATGERSFSVLKYIKNYLQSMMNEDRLNGITDMYINHAIALDYSKVMEEFSRCNHRLSFV